MNRLFRTAGRYPYHGSGFSFFGAPNLAPGNHSTRHATSGYFLPNYNRKSVAMSGDNFENRKHAADFGKQAVQRTLHTIHRQRFPGLYIVHGSDPWGHILTDAFPYKPGCKSGLRIFPCDFSLRQRGFRNRSKAQSNFLTGLNLDRRLSNTSVPGVWKVAENLFGNTHMASCH
jgi:hypothetical protein